MNVFGRGSRAALRHAGRSMSTPATAVVGEKAELGIAKHRNVMNLFDKVE